jgi:hypothetical protein
MEKRRSKKGPQPLCKLLTQIGYFKQNLHGHYRLRCCTIALAIRIINAYSDKRQNESSQCERTEIDAPIGRISRCFISMTPVPQNTYLAVSAFDERARLSSKSRAPPRVCLIDVGCFSTAFISRTTVAFQPRTGMALPKIQNVLSARTTPASLAAH